MNAPTPSAAGVRALIVRELGAALAAAWQRQQAPETSSGVPSTTPSNNIVMGRRLDVPIDLQLHPGGRA